ncbi:MAG: hypothetical protein D6698_00405 [Gammaproteobacteria bacterium]|nr:MAG: hypothetical protein D6698_00405 [Gammaproteobacteria bacterium]
MSLVTCKDQPRSNISDDDIHPFLDQGGILLTCSVHLARNLRQYVDRSRQEYQSVWSSPKILPWSAWLEDMWDTAMLSGQIPPLRLLSSQHEKKVWQQIIVEDSSSELVYPAGLARQAQNAWRLWLDHEHPHGQNRLGQESVNQSFFAWAQKFSEICRANGWVSQAELPWKLVNYLSATSPPITASVALAGFDRLTPAQECLLDFLQERGVSIVLYERSPRQARIMAQPCTDPEEEIRLAASWAFRQLEESPERRLGIIVPDLEARKKSLQRNLDEILFPQKRLSITSRDGVCPYRFSTGESLASFSMIRDAIVLLEFQFQDISLNSLTTILLSPYLPGWSEEYHARADLALFLRETGAQQVKPGQLAAMIRDQASCPVLLQALQSILPYQFGSKDSLFPQQWVQRFISLLQEAGWGQGRALDDREMNLLDAWKQLLNGFSAAQEIWGRLTLENALSHLREMATETVFQAEQGDVPIEVVGIHDCAGLQFDAVWLLGWHDGVWPERRYRNPLISADVQKRWGITAASEELTCEDAATITRNIFSSANEIQVGLPRVDGDQLLQPSPMISDYLDDKAHSQVYRIEELPRLYSLQKTSSIESFSEKPIPFQSGKKVHGGSAILELQSACPFQAFACFRLHVKAPSRTQVGPSERLHGSLLHAVLERFWDQVGDRNTLAGMDQGEVQGRVKTIIDSIFHEQLQSKGMRFSENWEDMMKSRLLDLVMNWLNLERSRDDFSVTDRECSSMTDVGGLKLRIKIDRVDQIHHGQDLLLIDYKTGRVSPSGWFSERPEDPQLPLYCRALHQKGRMVRGLALGLIRKDGVALLGLAADEGFPDKIKPFHKHELGQQYQSWEQMLQDWDRVLEGLAQDFLMGKATPDPRKFPETCRYCRLQTLCRIDEMRKAL